MPLQQHVCCSSFGSASLSTQRGGFASAEHSGFALSRCKDVELSIGMVRSANEIAKYWESMSSILAVLRVNNGKFIAERLLITC